MSTARNIFTPRQRTPSMRAVRAVELYLGAKGSKSKAEAIREAKYSEAMARKPNHVFDTKAVRELMTKMGLDETPAINAVKRNLNSRRLEHMTFPPFREKSETNKSDGGEDIDDEQDYTTGEKRGEQLSDKEITELLASVNCVVRKIVHGDMARHVYFWSDKDKAQLEAADMIFNLLGSYAPKKVEGKHDHRVGIFSMKELREKMKEKGVKVTDPIINNDTIYE